MITTTALREPVGPTIPRLRRAVSQQSGITGMYKTACWATVALCLVSNLDEARGQDPATHQQDQGDAHRAR